MFFIYFIIYIDIDIHIQIYIYICECNVYTHTPGPGPSADAAPKAKAKAKTKAKAKAKSAPGSGAAVVEQTPKTMEQLASELSVLSAFMDGFFWCVKIGCKHIHLQWSKCMYESFPQKVQQS